MDGAAAVAVAVPVGTVYTPGDGLVVVVLAATGRSGTSSYASSTFVLLCSIVSPRIVIVFLTCLLVWFLILIDSFIHSFLVFCALCFLEN